MKKNILKVFVFVFVFAAVLVGCKNGNQSFPDYEGGTLVYFAYQNPIRTLVMGEDEYNTDMDNAHKCMIYATMGGSYSGRDIKLEIAVDNSLVNNLFFDEGYAKAIKAMPESYYKLASNVINYNGGVQGGVEVEFTDAFFNDPKSVDNTYVIPVVIKSQTGADKILSGTPLIEGETPQRTNYGRWDDAPMDYVLYLVKYICKYDCNYMRRGVDQITSNGSTRTDVRHGATVEKDEVKSDVTTVSLSKIKYPLRIKVTEDTVRECELIITFDPSTDKVTSITSNTPGVNASGTGAYETKAELKSWNNKDRDRLVLDYNIDFGGGVKVATKDTLVWQSRGVVVEEFPSYYRN